MRYHLIVFFLLINLSAISQDPSRFHEEVMDIQKKYETISDSNKETLVFTGSSSIRLWDNLEELFPDHRIINSGFGGSQASDLLAYTNELIIQYNPYKVFIYEGDNDINDKKRPKEIISVTKQIISKIRKTIPGAQIVIISAKPSLARWNLKGKYKRLNRKFKKLCANESNLDYAYIWDIMMEGKKLKQDIFIEDGLHLNSKGYELWYRVIKNFVQ